MNPELQAQTDAILQAFNRLHFDLLEIHITVGILLLLIFLALIFRRR
jgi:hypothetical protein